MNTAALETIARKLVADSKGILAADESVGTIGKHFAEWGIELTEENRRAYRNLLFTAPGIEQYISGVILFDETIRETTDDDVPFPKFLEQKGIIPGIKVDKGTAPFNEATTELATVGLEGLETRLHEYKAMGAQFAKWRAVFSIGPGTPSEVCIAINADLLAEYAALCQQYGIVPIVEPEVLMDGGHTIEECYEVTKKVLEGVFSSLRNRNVYLPGILLKPNMIVAGSESGTEPPAKVAAMTLECLRAVVPSEVPGIVFLSGGQSEEEATANLQAINAAKGDAPWALTFSFGRALQHSALKTWAGKPENVAAAQAEFIERARLNSQAAA